MSTKTATDLKSIFGSTREQRGATTTSEDSGEDVKEKREKKEKKERKKDKKEKKVKE